MEAIDILPPGAEHPAAPWVIRCASCQDSTDDPFRCDDCGYEFCMDCTADDHTCNACDEKRDE